jgi:hypothetical protein
MARHQPQHRGPRDIKKTLRSFFSADLWANDLQGRAAMWGVGLFVGLVVGIGATKIVAAALAGLIHLVSHL